jgi:hypothetical protein
MTGSASRLLIVAFAVLAAGCASAGPEHSASTPVISTQPAQAAHVQTASELAEQLLDNAHVPPGAVRSARPPTRSLSSPPEDPMVSGLVVKYRWWRINLPLQATYAWISRHQSATVSSIGSSSSGGPLRSDVEQDADFAPPTLPRTVNSARLSIAVTPLSAQTSAIGAFAVVVQQPPRRQIEDVPATIDSVMVVTRRTSGEPDGGQILGRTTVTGVAARQLVRDFNALDVQPPGQQFSCPLSFVTQAAIFRSGSRVWIATTGVCVGVGVSFDGQTLPTLDTSNTFTRDLRAAYGHRFPNALVPQPMTHPLAQTSTVSR